MTKRKSIGQEIIDGLDEALAYARGEIELPTRVYTPPTIDIIALRRRLKLSRAKFALRFGLDLRAVQDWEQGRRQPDRAARVLLKVIETAPETVARIVGETAA